MSPISIVFSDDLDPPLALQRKFQTVLDAKGTITNLGDAEWNILRKTLFENPQIRIGTGIPTVNQGPQGEREDRDFEIPVVIGNYERDLPSIFISYRRRDSAWAVRLIADHLHSTFGGDIKIFLDVDSIGYGDRFDLVIEEEIQKTNVIMVIIGPSWLTLSIVTECAALTTQTTTWSRRLPPHSKMAKRLFLSCWMVWKYLIQMICLSVLEI